MHVTISAPDGDGDVHLSLFKHVKVVTWVALPNEHGFRRNFSAPHRVHHARTVRIRHALAEYRLTQRAQQ